MKISTKGRYALRLMLDLAIHYEDTYISLKDISKRQQISTKYLEQIIIPLHKALFLKSCRGAQGGYKLAKAPEDFTVGEILKVMEGGLIPVACLSPDSEKTCSRNKDCVTISVYKKIQQAIDDVVDNITLADLVEDSKTKPFPNCHISN